MEQGTSNQPQKNSIVLCFDGTGNKFSGNESDSNILKIYRLLDRNAPNQYSWYNPGIGTYVQTTSLDHTGAIERMKSWYTKAKDEAVGSSLGDHVMAGYRFLMRYYNPEDDIYIFGFSRGAYTARFLAEMLDHVGLLSAGNEELQRFAWKCFSKWQARGNATTDKEKEKAKEQYTFMKNFRETFSRPVRRIRFLGLFDTVNSVPRFENAMLQRTKYPYTARSSAKVIRHAVSVDERRAKFRVDLCSGKRNKQPGDTSAKEQPYQTDFPEMTEDIQEPANGYPKQQPLQDSGFNGTETPRIHTTDDIPNPSNLQPPQPPYATKSMEDLQLHTDDNPRDQRHFRRRFSDAQKIQDILEVWFAGNHGDIGGGWDKAPSETWQMAHSPLVWMVREAGKAGLKFDEDRLVALNCSPDKIDDYGNLDHRHAKNFHDALHQSSTSGFLHDCLRIGGGLPTFSVLSWKFMEHLPFRRMNLTADGQWKPIRWPLPMGETRDVPADAKVHISALQRMQADKSYRPGNLILLGKGGRGHRYAPKKAGTGEWVAIMNRDDPAGAIYVSKAYAEKEGVIFDTNDLISSVAVAAGPETKRG